MDQKLVAFLRAEAARPFDWGDHDCGLRLADWYVAKTGKPDPAAHLRGTYSGIRDCRALYGFAAVLRQTRHIMRALALPRVSEPKEGDIAVLRVLDAAVGTIRVPAGWSVLSPHGLTRLTDDEARAIAIWRIV